MISGKRFALVSRFRTASALNRRACALTAERNSSQRWRISQSRSPIRSHDTWPRRYFSQPVALMACFAHVFVARLRLEADRVRWGPKKTRNKWKTELFSVSCFWPSVCAGLKSTSYNKGHIWIGKNHPLYLGSLRGSLCL